MPSHHAMSNLISDTREWERQRERWNKTRDRERKGEQCNKIYRKRKKSELHRGESMQARENKGEGKQMQKQRLFSVLQRTQKAFCVEWLFVSFTSTMSTLIKSKILCCYHDRAADLVCVRMSRRMNTQGQCCQRGKGPGGVMRPR